MEPPWDVPERSPRDVAEQEAEASRRGRIGGPGCAWLLGRGSPGISPSDKELQGGSDGVGQGAAELRERR